MKSFGIWIVGFGLVLTAGSLFARTERVEAYGYEDCIRISNDEVEVVLDPNVGGRVLAYTRNGTNVLYINKELNGKIYRGPDDFFEVCAGRIDIGHGFPSRPDLWIKKWASEITGEWSARMTSEVCSVTGFQLVRDFTLVEKGSRLEVTQTITNRTDETKRVSHWGRTFVTGGGIAYAPINPDSRYDEGFATNGEKNGSILVRHEDHPSVRIREGVLEIFKSPPFHKFYMDGHEGWLAYLTPENLLFYKTYKIFPEAMYGDRMASTASIWYSGDRVCEIEPMGPLVYLEPEESTEFSEQWYLVDFDYPEDGSVDLEQLKIIVSK